MKKKIIFWVLVVATTVAFLPLSLQKGVGSGYSITFLPFSPFIIFPFSLLIYDLLVFRNRALKFLAVFFIILFAGVSFIMWGTTLVSLG